MGFFDRLLGREDQPPTPPVPQRVSPSQPARSDDEIAVERYQYLLRTAPPDTIEQVHTEAFGKLTEEQRQMLFQKLSENANPGERPTDAAPSSLAKAATRAEIQEPGSLQRAFGGNGGQGVGGRGGPSFGSMMGSSILGTVAGFVIGSALVSAFMPPMDGATDASGSDSGADSGDSGSDAGGDAGGDTSGGGDSGGGGDFGGGGGDFGGGADFGGDFGF